MSGQEHNTDSDGSKRTRVHFQKTNIELQILTRATADLKNLACQSGQQTPDSKQFTRATTNGGRGGTQYFVGACNVPNSSNDSKLVPRRALEGSQNLVLEASGRPVAFLQAPEAQIQIVWTKKNVLKLRLREHKSWESTGWK